MTTTKDTLSEIQGMPVITADTGKRTGNIAQIYIDPESKVLSALSFRDRETGREMYVDRADIAVLGEDVMIVRTAGAAKAVVEGKEPGCRFRKIRGFAVATHAGRSLGRLEDFDINRKTGVVSELHLSGGATLAVTAADLTIGPDLIMVPAGHADKVTIPPDRKGFFERMRDWTEQHVLSAFDSVADDKETTKKATSGPQKQPAAKQPAAKQPAAKQPAAKQPAAKQKPASQKAATTKKKS